MIHTYTHTHTHPHTHTHTHPYTYTYTKTCVYIYTYKDIHIYIHNYIYIYMGYINPPKIPVLFPYDIPIVQWRHDPTPGLTKLGMIHQWIQSTYPMKYTLW